MTEKTTNTEIGATASHPYKKLSIQVSLNGLSFCIIDTIGNSVEQSETIPFKSASTPYLVLKVLKALFETHKVAHGQYASVSVIHCNDFYCLVPRALFQKEELPNYLKFNTKLLASDEIVFDELPNCEMNCVYVPFTNINNYLFDLFGPFDFSHQSTNLIQLLLKQKPSNKAVCYVHIANRSMSLAVIEQKKVLLYNQFEFGTKEDLLYYVLFTYEQLQLDPESIKLRLFGAVEDGDEHFSICHEYIKEVAVFMPHEGLTDLGIDPEQSFDLTLLG